MTTSKEHIKNNFGKLPSFLQQYLVSEELQIRVRSIGEEVGLHVDKLGMLYDEVLHLLSGVTAPDAFTKNLESQLMIGEEVVQELIALIDVFIVEDFRKKIQVYQAQGEKRDTNTDLGENKHGSTAPTSILDMKTGGATFSPKEAVEKKPASSYDPYRESVDE